MEHTHNIIFNLLFEEFNVGCRVQQHFSVKNQIVNILGFGGPYDLYCNCLTLVAA